MLHQIAVWVLELPLWALPPMGECGSRTVVVYPDE
jgi:hypothetical protein